jgi:hypothetical protein
MLIEITDGACDDGFTCPAVYVLAEDEEAVVVRGYAVTDAAQLAQLNLPTGETVVRIPRAQFLEAAQRMEQR